MEVKDELQVPAFPPLFLCWLLRRRFWRHIRGARLHAGGRAHCGRKRLRKVKDDWTIRELRKTLAGVVLLAVTARVPAIALRAREKGFPRDPKTIRVDSDPVLDHTHVGVCDLVWLESCRSGLVSVWLGEPCKGLRSGLVAKAGVKGIVVWLVAAGALHQVAKDVSGATVVA